MKSVVGGRWWILILVGMAGLTGAPRASGEVLHLASGHFIGVAPHAGVSPRSFPGAVAARAASAEAGVSAGGDPGTLSYYGGAVVHSSRPYLIFWTPGSDTIPSPRESLLERFFTDVAADSGQANDVYAVTRQYYDGSGFADNAQSFSTASQVIVDTDPYPATNATNCPDTASAYPTCLTDGQLQDELAHEVAVDGLPTDGTSTSALPAAAPIYFIVLPSDVNVCFTQTSCADSGSQNAFCAYHSAFTDENDGDNVLYAAIPTLILGAGENPKGCQYDSNAGWPVQKPNGNVADVVLKYLNHEDEESITDPFGNAWIDPVSGNESGDNCNAYGTASPGQGTSPDAFAPTLGGSAASGTLYDQLINGDEYYLQSEWSNGDGACDLTPAAGAVSPSFSPSATSISPGQSITFDPSASASTNAYSSATWDFGDGSPETFHSHASALAEVSHTFATAGSYTVTLTLVDNRGNLATTTRQVSVGIPPTASFSNTADPGSGETASFDASASSTTSGTITGYAWTFGDGASGSGETASHVYAAPGTYTVTLTVTASNGQTASTSQPITVAGPEASFTAPAWSPLGGAAAFDASASTPAPGSTLTDVWSFDDGATATGASATHTFATAGTHTVTLTVTNNLGQSDSVSHTLVVDAAPTAAFSAPATGTTTAPVGFDAGASADGTSPIDGYAWSFGDGTSGQGATPTHLYAAPGTYTVTLTVTDGYGQTSAVSHLVTVHAPPVAAFALASAQPVERSAITFTAAPSSDPEAGVPIVSEQWSFGDGATASGELATHAYARPGTYAVTLTVTNGAGLSDATTELVAVGALPPAAGFLLLTPRPAAGAAVGFDAAASTDAGSITGYAWSFGDGTSGSGPAPSHVYAAPGTYTVTLTVTASDGQRATVSAAVTVARAGRVAAVRVRRVGGGALLLISVTGPGRLEVGRHAVLVHGAGTAEVRLRLTPAESLALARHHAVRLRAAITFVPLYGATTARAVTVALPAGRAR